MKSQTKKQKVFVSDCITLLGLPWNTSVRNRNLSHNSVGKIKGSEGWVLLQAVRDNSLHASCLTLVLCGKSLGLLGLQGYQPDLSLHKYDHGTPLAKTSIGFPLFLPRNPLSLLCPSRTCSPPSASSGTSPQLSAFLQFLQSPSFYLQAFTHADFSTQEIPFNPTLTYRPGFF